MPKIIPKLNLNKTPQSVENNSLIFAKNIKLGKDTSIKRDNGYVNISLDPSDLYILLWKNTDNLVKELLYRNADDTDDIIEYNIIKIIPYNTMFILLLKLKVDSIILSYNELTKTYTYHSCNWHYSGGEIDGNIIVNLRNELLLTIAESNIKSKVPIKTINLTKSSIKDDESIYTQAPKLSFINLNLSGKYSKAIPCGVYQFFIRYKISKNNYTNWFPASVELFAGNNNILATQQGTIKTMDPNMDSDESFILSVELVQDYGLYKEFQLGFIISHDDEVYARSYKHYPITTSTIYFDYDTEFIEEINVTDFLEPTYNIYNVKHITNFKNKQYIANYKESNFNIDPDTVDGLTEDFNITIVGKASSSTVSLVNVFDEVFDVTYESKNSNTYITTLNNIGIKDYLEKILTLGKPFNNNKSFIVDFLNREDSALIRLPQGNGDSDTYIDTFSSFTISIELTKTCEVPGEETWQINNIEWQDIRDFFNYLPTKINITNNTFADDDYQSINIPIYIRRKERASTGINIMNDYTGTISIKPTFRNNSLNTETAQCFGPSLLPYQTYEFYVHFVTKYGEIMNGILLDRICLDENQYIYANSKTELFDYVKHIIKPEHKYVFYPVFEDIHTNEDYPVFFISIKHIANRYTDVVNLQPYGISSNNEYILGDVIDYNLRLNGNYNNIKATIYDDNEKTIVDSKYHRSSDASKLITFGSSGKLVIKNVGNSQADNNGYILERFTHKADNNLIRCTGFMKSTHEIPNYNLNLEGYLSQVYCLRSCLDEYYSGTDKYTKKYNQDETFTLEYKAFDSTFPYYEQIAEIYSEYNLNYLALQNDSDFVPKTKTEEKQIGEKIQTIKVLVMVKDSLNLTDVYKLPNMYKTYTRPLYSVTNLDDTVESFTNTIRSSALIADESTINKFIFKATDYYNIPTDKGIITNLISVGNGILVHTQDSLFKFSGNNSLSANGGENIQLKESEVFETGITEVFGSQYGFGGLSDKKHSLVIEAGYIFYDKDSNIIYMYAGEGQITPISDSIEKLLLGKPTDIYISNDYYNDRLFFLIKYTTDSLVLSYNLKLASFISIHDIIYNTSFNTKTNCYFIKDNNIYIKSDNTYNIPLNLQYISNKYPGIYYSKNDNTPACVVDVIYNANYDSIKTLNAVNWICNKIKSFYDEQGMGLRTAEENLDSNYAGDEIQIYSEHTLTDKILLSPRSNDESLMRSVYTGPTLPKTNSNESNSNQRQINPDNNIVQLTAQYVNEESYQRPRFNLGFWTLNYFRNTLNNIHNQDNYGLDDTLIYGKYIVVRFIFNPDNNFKLENLSLNLQYNQ